MRDLRVRDVLQQAVDRARCDRADFAAGQLQRQRLTLKLDLATVDGVAAVGVTRADGADRQTFEWGEIVWLDSAELTGNEALTVGEVTIYAGEANGEHYHPNCDEALYLLSGELTHTLGEEETVLQPGDLVTLLRRIGSQALLYHVLLRREALPSALDINEGAQRFQATDLHPGLVEPIQTGSLGSRLPHWFQESRSLRHALAEGYADNDPVGTLVRDAYGRHVAVAMVPVEDMAGRPLGYAVSESSAAPVIAWRNQVAISAGVVFLLVGALSNVAVLMVRWRRGARALREQMNAITESMGEGVYVLDATGRVGYVNQAASAMLGYRPDEITGAKANALFYDSSGAQGRPTRIPGWDVLRTGGTYRSDRHELRRRDGTSLPVSLTVSPLRGIRRGVVAVFRRL
jgi:PAS domain S-box-containing protein